MKSTVSFASRVAFSSARKAFTASGDRPLGAAATTVCGWSVCFFGLRISARVGGVGVVLQVILSPSYDFSHSVVVPVCCPNAVHAATSRTRNRIAPLFFMDALLVRDYSHFTTDKDHTDSNERHVCSSHKSALGFPLSRHHRMGTRQLTPLYHGVYSSGYLLCS